MTLKPKVIRDAGLMVLSAGAGATFLAYVIALLVTWVFGYVIARSAFAFSWALLFFIAFGVLVSAANQDY